jgi:hypothetical protein
MKPKIVRRGARRGWRTQHKSDTSFDVLFCHFFQTPKTTFAIALSVLCAVPTPDIKGAKTRFA